MEKPRLAFFYVVAISTNLSTFFLTRCKSTAFFYNGKEVGGKKICITSILSDNLLPFVYVDSM